MPEFYGVEVILFNSIWIGKESFQFLIFEWTHSENIKMFLKTLINVFLFLAKLQGLCFSVIAAFTAVSVIIMTGINNW